MVDLTIDGDVALITMDDGRANVFNMGSISDILSCLEEAEANSKAIVLAGRSGMFSGGFDLKALRGGTADEAAALVNEGGKMALRFIKSPKPIVAACTGHAIAMGLFMVLACDYRIGAEGEFKSGANETFNNMPLPVFAAEITRVRINPAHYTRAMVFSEIFDPAGALEAGIFDMLAPVDKTVDEAKVKAAALAELPEAALAFNKSIVRAPMIAAFESSLG